MTSLPPPGAKKLGLVIDLDICVGCHACAVNCKEWNSGGHSAPLTDLDPYGPNPLGVWFNRVHTFEAGEGGESRTVHFPRSCLHCEQPACVTVCPTGASYKRAEDGIVLVNEDICIGCKLCSWACPYGAREYDYDRRRDEEMHALHRPHLQRDARRSRSRAGLRRDLPGLGAAFRRSRRSRIAMSRCWSRSAAAIDLMPEMGYKPVNKYLPPRPRRDAGCAGETPARWRRARRCRPGPIPSCAGSIGCCRADPMHPALSVILFTTASGAGYGLLFLARGADRDELLAGEPLVRRGGLRRSRSARSPSACSPRPSISAGRSAPGAPSRNGEARGCRARASPRSSPTCRLGCSPSTGSSAARPCPGLAG